MVRSQAVWLTIGELAGESGVGVETVRYYQRRGLMRTPARPAGGGIRHYGEDDRRRLRFIRAAQDAGFTLDQVGELVLLDATLDRPEALALARKQMAILDERIARLIDARAALATLADSCAAGGTGPCPIIAAFDRPGSASGIAAEQAADGDVAIRADVRQALDVV
ncbi:MerR family transcriptional regulator [Sphingomonas bacterium]|uniref:MerR family transcriptional regulator n=1 Tax=Sphingomonas bacterium TaxID=1895847 RepID=UPI001576A946|nr:MerR family transcriptional regulator [Sphingomonas bacterium]